MNTTAIVECSLVCVMVALTMAFPLHSLKIESNLITQAPRRSRGLPGLGLMVSTAILVSSRLW
jgi:hypothetical protein